MRVTGLGHAGLFIETAAGSVLCDPWQTPAFFTSWFPFPDNTDLDWSTFGAADYLYVSHLHRDHCDAELLRGHVSRKATVLLPEFATDELERELSDLGFRSFVRTETGQQVDLDGLRVAITALTAPDDGPIGDSVLALDDGEAVLLNQNDAHPVDIEALREFGDFDAHFLQFSGAIWWPMVYDLPQAAKREFGRRKRASQNERAFRFIDAVGAKHVFPTAGPPCFLDADLWHLNDLHRDEDNIFPDQACFLDLMEDRGYGNGHLMLPGTVAELERSRCTTAHPLSPAEIRSVFEDKEEYLRAYAHRQCRTLEREHARLATPAPDLLDELKGWWEPLLRRADHICAGVGGPVRFDVGDQPLVVDFGTREVREWAGENCRYRFWAPAALVATCVARREPDWSNSLFLSMRFRASRIGPYNEYVYTFFKCLTEERIDYVERWYADREDGGEDIVLDGWRVQRHCPHLRGDLSRFGTIEDGVLTCSMHGWSFDLESGHCLTSPGHDIRASRVDP